MSVAVAVAAAPVIAVMAPGCLATAPVCAAEIAEIATGGASGQGAVAYAEYTEGYEDYKSWQVLCAHLAVSPDSTASPAYCIPHVLVEVAADMYSRPMDPDQLAEFIETVAGQLEELRRMHPRLTAARAEWAARADTTADAEAA
ncbi:hypothetical protein [Streptomyces sp. NPDC047061]|uniref:DUF6907 domain-containing protein n=1 Tax=Streptomyces sp. NPDC047061 TaxID=3154605 RepID=UPI0033EB773B